MRSAATVGGNLILARERNLESNLVPLVQALGGHVEIIEVEEKR